MKLNRRKQTAKQRRLGLAARILLSRPRTPKMTPQQLHRKDFKTSTQRIGIRFSERLRNAFRCRWLKLK